MTASHTGGTGKHGILGYKRNKWAKDGVRNRAPRLGLAQVQRQRGDTEQKSNEEGKTGKREKPCRHHHLLYKDDVSPGEATAKPHAGHLHPARGPGCVGGCSFPSSVPSLLPPDSSSGSGATRRRNPPRRWREHRQRAGGRQEGKQPHEKSSFNRKRKNSRPRTKAASVLPTNQRAPPRVLLRVSL